MKKPVNVQSVSKDQLIFAQKDMAFNAVMFVWQSFLSIISRYDGEDTARSYMESFRATYDLISKQFITKFKEVK